MNNKGNDNNQKNGNADMLTAMMSMMNGGKNDLSGVMNAMNNKASVNSAETDSPKQNSKNNCREPRFWDSPARDANSIPPMYPNMKSSTDRNSNKGNNNKSEDNNTSSNNNSGGINNNTMNMIQSMMGGGSGGNDMSKLAPLLSMMNGGANSGGNNDTMNMIQSMMGGESGGSDMSKLAPLLSMMGGNKGGGGLMSMLPLLSMMNSGKNSKVSTASVNNKNNIPLKDIDGFCPLETRMRIHYFLSKN